VSTYYDRNSSGASFELVDWDADADALRKALERRTDECNAWRSAYLRQTARLDKLAAVIKTLEDIRNGNA
jgi:hypothetical protein